MSSFIWSPVPYALIYPCFLAPTCSTHIALLAVPVTPGLPPPLGALAVPTTWSTSSLPRTPPLTTSKCKLRSHLPWRPPTSPYLSPASPARRIPLCLFFPCHPLTCSVYCSLTGLLTNLPQVPRPVGGLGVNTPQLLVGCVDDNMASNGLGGISWILVCH